MKATEEEKKTYESPRPFHTELIPTPRLLGAPIPPPADRMAFMGTLRDALAVPSSPSPLIKESSPSPLMFVAPVFILWSDSFC